MGHGSHASDNNPDVLEREKQRNLQGGQPLHAPGMCFAATQACISSVAQH